MSKADEMKIIDLLNKIVNGEEVPNRIKCNNKIFEYHDNSKNYYDIENYEEPLFNETIAIFLNEEVELIEEDTIDIDSIEEINMITERDDDLLRNIVDNQNKLLQWAKQADKEIKELKEK